MTKLTYADALNAAIAVESLPVEIREKLTALREQINKRNVASDKPTKAQVANEGVKSVILSALETVGKPVTVTELQESNDQLGALSNQKVSALLRQLVESNAVVKSVDKRKTYFAIAADDGNQFLDREISQ